MRKITIIIKFFILLSCFQACNEENLKNGQDFATLDQGVIYGKRKLKQIRGQLIDANDQINSSSLPLDVFDRGSSALLGRSSASIFNTHYACANNDVVNCECTQTMALSSGNLTSPSRLMASLHGIYTEVPAVSECRYGVAFESSISSTDYQKKISDAGIGVPYPALFTREREKQLKPRWGEEMKEAA